MRNAVTSHLYLFICAVALYGIRNVCELYTKNVIHFFLTSVSLENRKLLKVSVYQNTTDLEREEKIGINGSKLEHAMQT